jgi:maleylacetoacetate isomerase
VKLYGYYRSSAAYRVRIALNLKGVAYEAVPVDLRPAANAQHSPGFLALNPQGLVPVLIDGERIVTQSLAIIEYLDEVRRQPPLLPDSAVDRAQVRSLALAIACDIHPLNNTRVLGYLRAQLGADEAAVNAWYANWVTRGLRALEALVARLGSDGRHMFGGSVTLADVCLVPQMYNARRFNCDLAPCPTLVSICAHLETLPAFARAAPEAQPDAAA